MAAPGIVLPPDIAAQNKGPTILATSITVTVLSTLFVAARLFVRGRIIGTLYLDDYFMIAAMICSWVTVGASANAVAHGSGRHAAVLNEEQLSGAILWTMVGFVPGVLSFALPKLAVVALLTRMMNPARWHAILMWVLAVWCLVSLMGCVAILFGQCTPTRAMWTFSIKGECWSPWVLVNYSIYAGSFSAFTDLYFAVYPAIVLCNLQLNLKKKIALSCALGIGSVATVVAIYKTTRIPGLASPDFVYDTADLTIWTAVEGSTIMIAASIPILKPLMDLLLGRRAFSSNKSYPQYEKYGRSRSGQADSDIEMSRPGVGRSRKRQGDKRAATTTTISQLETVVDAEGFEDGRRSAGHDSQTGIVSPPALAPPLTEPPSVGIMRTDHVTVTTTYDAEVDKRFLANRWG
ncbi:hypothetical protein C8A01DRAFT_19467 [Parachaetomium inaequale]|uniref:Rhodopsin domain-containing protein n=1 Tax=Parachaetomium inaequale TaxID=2588326 RepID=A0AAN6SNG1_9PEZI|nr:hypothetical protein C8A01DRAFT_19467 [Parachaetomium inaequale]